MTDGARPKVLREYEAFMEQLSGEPRGTAPPRRLIDAAARAMLRVVLGEAECLDLPLTPGDAWLDDAAEDA